MGLSCGSSTCIKDFWQLAVRSASKSKSEHKGTPPRWAKVFLVGAQDSPQAGAPVKQPAIVLATSFSCDIASLIRRLSRGSTLFHDLEAVFLDDWIGEHFLGDALELLLRFVAVPAIEIQNEKFPLANIGNLRVAQAGKSVLNGLTLRVQNSAFRHNPDVSFHGVSIAIPSRLFTLACVSAVSQLSITRSRPVFSRPHLSSGAIRPHGPNLSGPSSGRRWEPTWRAQGLGR